MCEPGYIEIDGNCVYDFDSNVLPNGTPKAPGNQGDKKPFCETPVGRYLCDAVPVILVGGAGWFEGKFGDKPEKPGGGGAANPKTPQPQAPKSAVPVWGWIAIGVAVLAVVVALVRRK